MKQYTLEQQKKFLINFAIDNDFNTGERSFTINLMIALANSASILDLFSEEIELLRDQDMNDKEIEELIQNMLNMDHCEGYSFAHII